LIEILLEDAVLTFENASAVVLGIEAKILVMLLGMRWLSAWSLDNALHLSIKIV